MLRQRGPFGIIDVLLVVVIFVSGFALYSWISYLQAHPANTEDTSETSSTKTLASKSVTETIEDLNEQLTTHNLVVTLSPTNGDPSFSTWSELADTSEGRAAVEEFAGYLSAEFSKYPTDLVKNSELKTIGIVRDLKTSGVARASLPMPQINAMVYDPVYSFSGGEDYTSSMISHEFWHFLDYKMRGDYRYVDSEWVACNPAGFTYGSGGETAYDDPNFINTFNDRKGFVTEYATYGIEEDRAEMFGWLMYNPNRVKELEDTGIDCKTKRLTAIVRTLSPQMSF